jgi:hypothetical protein
MGTAIATLSTVRKRIYAIAAVSTVALIPAAQSLARPQTTAPPEVITVRINMTDTAFHVGPKSAPRGDLGRFILVNRGKKPHAFALGHTNHGTGSQTGFSRTLKPGQQVVLILFLDFRGSLPYRGTLPADRVKPAMQGTFRIT